MYQVEIVFLPYPQGSLLVTASPQATRDQITRLFILLVPICNTGQQACDISQHMLYFAGSVLMQYMRIQTYM